MAEEAERERPAEAMRRGMAFFPLFVGVVRDEDTAAEPVRLVLFNPITRGMVVLQGDPGVISTLMSSDPETGGPPPASKASIEALRVVHPEEDGGTEECSVCLDGLWRREAAPTEEEEVVREMPCGHRFHGGCVEKWLGMHGSCPLCRYLMPVAEEDPKKIVGDEWARARELVVTIAFERREGDASQQQQQQEEGEAE
ncbi:E3 ubiquitin-protein ligase MPSR1-like [Curcuma longa]|uniref:E3 ubiquitin-protein ligase MPSR1-like n=1 Tax=Curcuma longa TaxID=136217 RepID=UPI003D9ECFA6